MAKRKKSPGNIDFPFYVYLKSFHDDHRKEIYSSYKPLTRKFLRFNDPGNGKAFLRLPQFEALEIYVLLKEFAENKYLFEIFGDWYQKQGKFENRKIVGVDTIGQVSLFGPKEVDTEDTEMFEQVFKQIESFKQIYPNFIFALTMGLGKTILMATSIFYEFLLANKYPKDEKYCHNALVFAPDKTVLQSLKEIEVFDKSLVIPPEYVNWLEMNLKFHFLDNTGISLNAIDRSNFNIIITNTQKIILKRQKKESKPSQLLFQDYSKKYKAKSLNEDYDDLYQFDIDTDVDLITNQRFAKLTRLSQLGIYVDEAHHVFGNKLAKDFGLKKAGATSLRVTINNLAVELAHAGTQVVGCYNYTGTPYVGKRLLPEVVYAFGLKEAIENGYLKRVKIHGFENVKSQTKAFVRLAIEEFWGEHEGKRYEGMLPKFAFFASSIAELQNELKPVMEEVLADLGIPTDKILVNVGDTKLTTNDDLREFRNLDTPGSDKQFILLVNKGKEGWNCRSLFAVGLHRQPKSKVFVLQATMRCLRAIGDVQERGNVYLAKENITILEKELDENFRISLDEFTADDKKEKDKVAVRPVPPPVKVRLKRVKKLFDLKEKEPGDGVDLELEKAPVEKYKVFRSERDIEDISKKISKDIDVSYIREQREWSSFTLTAEIAKYLNKSPLAVNHVLAASTDGVDEILKWVNEFNELIYDWIIPRLFKEFYEVKEFKSEEEEDVSLIREEFFDNDSEEKIFYVKAKKELILALTNPELDSLKSKSFHLDHYCFDSIPEKDLFISLLKNEKVKKVWFTGMLTHGQSDFKVNYIDPESHTVRSYYPDFLVEMTDGSYLIIEVKADFMVDDSVVKAKEDYARQLAVASGMKYSMVKGSEVGAFDV